MSTFESFSLPEPVLRALTDLGFTEATPIQGLAIPPLLEGRDAIGQARTGTGKTAAFGLPLIVRALEGVPGLVLVPTRELAQQVARELTRLAAHVDVRVLALYGGASFPEQARELARGCDIVVATPGRLRDHLERGTLQAAAAGIVVLDEADEMLKMGFVEEVEEILDAVGAERQTALFSATMPEGVARLAQRYMRDPVRITAPQAPRDEASVGGTTQRAILVEPREKADVLVRMLAVEGPEAAIVFRHTRDGVEDLVETLRKRGFEAEALHGGMAQPQREAVLARLRDGRASLVVATDVAARGLDVDRLTHVFNFDAPRETDAYVHRIGRTGRAGRDGASFVFVTPMERRRVRMIEQATRTHIQWLEVPSDADVRAAVAKRAAVWLQERAATASEDALALVDRAIENGGDARTLAASLVERVARIEGFGVPPLEPRRTHPRPHERTRPHAAAPNGRGHPAQHDGPRVPIALAVGRDDGVRPGDLVGALTNEGGLVGAHIGRIDILPRMSVVEVPADSIGMLMDTMANATIRGRRSGLRVAERWEFRAPRR